MNFAWTPEQERLHRQALAFAQTLRPVGDQAGQAHKESWRQLGEFGFLGLSVPLQCGGMGLDALTTAHVVEAFGQGSQGAGLIFSACAHLFAAAMPIAAHGSEQLKRRLLPRLCSGEAVAANAITEPAAGSDVFALETTARRVADGYLLNGIKSYVTNGPIADAIVVYASTEPKHGHLGISAFVVERGASGLTVGPALETTGLPGAPIGAVHFADCRVPSENLLGVEGAGAAIFQTSMLWERTCLFAMYLGFMERDLESTVKYARERKQFGKRIGQQQAVSHRLVDMRLRLEAARLLLYRACWLHDQGQDATVAVSLAKIAVSEAAVQSGLDVIQIHGGAGLISDGRKDQSLLDALPATIFSGTSQMQREIVARSMKL